MNKNFVLAGLFLVMVLIAWLQVPGIVKDMQRVSGLKMAPDEEIFIKDIELAKIILSPTKKTLDISRDPFQPLDYAEPLEALPLAASPSPKPVDPAPQVREDVKFLGAVMSNGETRAALSVKGRKGVFKPGDEVLSFKIATIDKDHIVLSNDSGKITIKRGDK